MTGDAAQALFDAMWAEGFRPPEHPASMRDQLGAVTRHLEDMRALAFAKTGVAKP